MYKINGTTITLTKGDSFYCQLTLTKDGETYTPDADDVIRFGMKKEYTDAKAVVTTVIPNDTLMLYLAPEATSSLACGKYQYDIEITFADGDIDTFINKAEFNLVPEVI